MGITQLAGQAAIAGDTSIFTLIAILSANLALLNPLPIPVLDGGGIGILRLGAGERPASVFAITGLCNPNRLGGDAGRAARPIWLPPFSVMRAAGLDWSLAYGRGQKPWSVARYSLQPAVRPARIWKLTNA